MNWFKEYFDSPLYEKFYAYPNKRQLMIAKDL